MKIRLFATIALAALAGCAAPVKPAPEKPDPAAVQLAAAAQDVRVSLRKLAEAEQFDKMRRTPGAADLTPSIPGLDQKVTMPWNGPLEPFVVKLAGLGGYEVEFAGRPPVLPIIVNIGPQPAPAAQLLRDAGLQAGDRADVIVDPQHKKVGVVYADTGL